MPIQFWLRIQLPKKRNGGFPLAQQKNSKLNRTWPTSSTVPPSCLGWAPRWTRSIWSPVLCCRNGKIILDKNIGGAHNYRCNAYCLVCCVAMKIIFSVKTCQLHRICAKVCLINNRVVSWKSTMQIIKMPLFNIFLWMRSHANRKYSEVVLDQRQKGTNMWMVRSITCRGWNRSN